MRVPHTPVLVQTVIASAAVAANRFVGFNGAYPAPAGRARGVANYAADKAGDAIAVTVLGTERIEAGGAFAAGDAVQVGGDGKAVVLAAGVKAGIAQDASTGDGDTVTVLLTP